MLTIRWRCVSDDDIISKIIKFVTRGEYSHIEFVFDGFTIGARSNGGVQKRTLDHYQTETYFHAEVSEEQYAKGMRFLINQLGKKYDFTDIFATFFNRDWHDSSRWDCSELFYDTMTAFGLFHYINPRICNRVTPQDGFLLSVAYFGGKSIKNKRLPKWWSNK